MRTYLIILPEFPQNIYLDIVILTIFVGIAAYFHPNLHHFENIYLTILVSSIFVLINTSIIYTVINFSCQNSILTSNQNENPISPIQKL